MKRSQCMPSMEPAEAYNAGMSIREEKTRTQESCDIYLIESRQLSNQNTKQQSASHFGIRDRTTLQRNRQLNIK